MITVGIKLTYGETDIEKYVEAMIYEPADRFLESRKEYEKRKQAFVDGLDMDIIRDLAECFIEECIYNDISCPIEDISFDETEIENVSNAMINYLERDGFKVRKSADRWVDGSRFIPQ